MKALRFDAGRLGKAEVTPQGFRRVPAYLARTGVLKYRNADGTERREYVPASELFSPASLASLRSAPVTIGHQAMVTPKNVKALQIGIVENPRQDGKYLAGDLLIQDEDAIKRVDAGELVECSLGYETDYEDKPGRADGEEYDGTQRARVYNHDALLPAGAGRAGRSVGLRFDGADVDASVCLNACYPDVVKGNRSDETQEQMKYRFDGKEYETPEAALAIAAEALASARKDAKDAKDAASAAEARADAAAEQLEQAKDPAKVRAAVAARVTLERNAAAVLGKSYKCDGKDERAIMVDVIRADSKKFSPEGKDDIYIRGRYDSVIERGVRADGPKGLHEAIVEARADGSENEDESEEREDGLDFPDVESAQERLRKDMAEAWKKPSHGSARGEA